MMSDQIEIQFPKTRVEEETAFDVEVYFRTRATKVALAPTTIHYRVDCLTTKETVTEWTSVSAAANVTITITSAMNQIRNGDSNWERKQIMIKADDGLSTQVMKTGKWIVDNNFGVT